MPTDVLMPPLSQTLDTMVLVEWLKKPGDAVAKGEPLFLVESDKATLEVESPASGTVAEVLVEAGAEVPIRACIARIAAAGESFEPAGSSAGGGNRTEPALPAQYVGAGAGANAGVAEAMASAGARIPLPAERARRIFASPRARQTAHLHHVALEAVAATGPQGLIVERDVLAHTEARHVQARVSPVAARAADHLAVDLSALASRPGARITRAQVEAVAREATAASSTAAADSPQAPEDAFAPQLTEAATGAGIPLESTRRTIARRLSQAHQTIVPVTLMRECDATTFVALRSRIVASASESEPRPSVTDLLAVTAARCLRHYPALNGTFDGERVYPSQEVHLALAVETARGLLAPVIRSCDRLGLMEVAAARLRLVESARAGTIAGDELVGGTFTLTNLGPQRVDAFTPVVNPPQIAILGVGRIRPAPAVWEGVIAVRQLLILSLTFDHRVVDGAPAARFLDDVALLIENPDRLWLLPG